MKILSLLFWKECTDDCVENLLKETNLLKTIIRVNVTSSLTPWERLQNATRKLEEILVTKIIKQFFVLYIFVVLAW